MRKLSQILDDEGTGDAGSVMAVNKEAANLSRNLQFNLAINGAHEKRVR